MATFLSQDQSHGPMTAFLKLHQRHPAARVMPSTSSLTVHWGNSSDPGEGMLVSTPQRPTVPLWLALAISRAVF